MTPIGSRALALALLALVALPAAADEDPAELARADATAADGRFTVPGELRAPRPDSPRRSVLVPALETTAVTGVVMAWNVWPGEAPWATITWDSIGRNLGGPWVLDDDQYWVNQFGHPYLGTWSFTAARSAGLGFWESVPFTLALSTFWEIVGETERPSVNDQLTTVIGGVVLGEAFFRSVGMIRGARGFWRELGAGILSPVAAFNRTFLGSWDEPPPNPTETMAWAGVLAFAKDRASDPLVGEGAALDLGLRLVYGPPGHPDTRIERPFDHFDLTASYGAYADPVASLLVRGLVLGGTFEGPRRRGLWGIYLGYDLLTPGDFRVSTVHLGLGTGTRFDLAPALALDLDVVVSGVPMGAAGSAYAGEDGKGRDYHLGGGVQGTLDARLRVARRSVLGLGARRYLVVGAGDGGRERITYLGGSALLRVWGPHALGAEAVLATRSATGLAGEPEVREEGHVLRLYYAWTPSSAAPVERSDPALR